MVMDKHILMPSSGPAGGQGPSSGTPSASANDATAQSVYGTPPAGTRMPRIGSEAAIAAGATPGWGDDNAENSIMDGSTLGAARPLSPPIKQGFGGGDSPVLSSAATVPGTPGFPGLPNDVTAQGTVVSAGAPGVSAVGTVSTHGVGESNQGNPQHSGGYGQPGQSSVSGDTPAADSYADPAVGAWGSGNSNNPQLSGNYPNPGSDGMTSSGSSDSPQWTGNY